MFKLHIWKVDVVYKTAHETLDENSHYFVFKRSAEKFVKKINKTKHYRAQSLSYESLWLNSKVEIPDDSTT